MANIIEQLNSKVFDLKSLIVIGDKNDQNSLSNFLVAKEISENIKSICDDFAPDSPSFSYFVAMLLSKSEENSLLNFLKTIITPKFLRFDDVISILVESITLVINKCDIDISAYVPDVIELCVNIIKQDGLKSKRECGYVLLNIVLEIVVSKRYNIESSVEDILQFCHRYLESSGLKQIENSAVKNGFYQLMGALCKYFPEKLTRTKRNYGHLFATVLSLEVKSQVSSKSKAPVYAVLEGCFYGFDGVLSNFADFFDTNPRVTLNQIYDYSKVLCDPETQISRHGPRKAALLLLTHHTNLFKQFFCNEFEILHNHFHHWTMHQDKDLRNAGFRAVDALLKQISICIVENMPNKPSESKIMYKAFVDKFDKRFENAITLREVALAVRGFGYFVEPMKIYHGSEYLIKVCKDICNRALLLFTNSTDSAEQKISYLPYFMESIANFLENIDKNDSGMIDSVLIDIEILHLHFFQNFPFLDKKYYDTAKDVCLKSLKSANRFDSNYTYRIVYQALIRILSLPTQSAILFLQDVTDNVNFNQKIMNFKDYMPLWILMLKNSVNDSAFFDSLLKIYDELLHRLDFTSFADNKEDDDSESQKKVERSTDYDIFTNMIDFYKDLIPYTTQANNVLLTSIFLPSLVELSIRYPRIGGFYKLMTSTLIASKKFAAQDGNSSMLKRFVEHTLVVMKSYKGDLLVSCLQFILSVPLLVVEPLLDFLSENLKFALKIGANYLPLAETCLDALEFWSESLLFERFMGLYRTILPDLEQYLSSEQIAVSSNDRLSERLAHKPVKKKQKLNRDKVKYRQSNFDADFNEKGGTATLYNVKYRVLMLIGQMGGQANSQLIEPNLDSIAENCTKWEMDDLLKFPVCFTDMKPSINLDPFLPRLCLLALSSGDRRTKTAACEALHSVIIFALGKWSQSQFDESVRTTFCRLFKRLLPTIIKLCCDVDEVPLKLFTLLFKQIIHWISGIKSNDNLEVNLLLDTLFAAAEDPDDPNLRDSSAKWFDEYLSWSIRQNRPENVENFFHRLINICRHSNSHKRLAACQIFNGIYRTFREYDDLIDKYLLELFVEYMICLDKCQYDDVNGIVSVAAEKTIIHLERILSKKQLLLSKKEYSRIKPKFLKDATIQSFTDWLFCNLGRTGEKFRRKCFEMLSSLDTKASFRNRFKKESLDTIIERFEGKFNDNNFGIYYKPIFFANDGLETLDWLKFLLAALDCYFASLFDDLVSIDDLFSKRHKMRLFDAIRCFLDNFQSSEEYEFTQRLKLTESKTIETLKCSIIVRLLQFHTCLLNKLSKNLLKDFENQDLFDDRIIILSLNVLFDPESQGFDVVCCPELSQNLNLILENYFHSLVKSCQVLPDRRAKIDSFVDSMIQNPLYQLPSDVRKFLAKSSKKNIDQICRVISGLQILAKTHVAERSRLNVDCEIILRNCVASDKTGDAISRKFFIDYLKLGFDFGLKIDDIMKILITLDTSKNSVGKQFFDNFKEFIVDFFVTHTEDFIKSLLSHAKIDSINLVMEILINSLTILVKNDRMRNRHGKFVGESVFMHCSNLLYDYRQYFFQNDTNSIIQWIGLFRLVGLLDSTVFWSPSENSNHVFDQYMKLMREKSHAMSLKIKLLSILPLFSKSEDNRSSAIKLSLDQFASNYLPLKSSEFSKGSANSEEYIAAIRKVLLAFELSNNVIIFEFLLNLICREAKHIMQEEIFEFLKRHCSNLSISIFLNLLAVPFNIFWDENSNDYTIEHRSNVLEKFLLPMLQGASMEVLKTFCLDKIRMFMEKVEQKFSKTDETAYSNLMISKLGVFNILTIMYESLPLEVLKGEINDRFVGQSSLDKTELIKNLLKILPEARREGKEDLTNGRKWLFRCAAHNCIVAILMATQTKLNIFEGFIFKDVWELISEPNKEYTFAVDYQNLPIRKKQSLSSKKEHTDETDYELQRLLKNQTQTLQFLSTQFLSESSLKSELTQYDFTASSSTGGSHLRSRKWSRESQMEFDNVDGNSKSSTDDVIEIEVDDLNSHPCMNFMLSVVKFMTEKKILNLEISDAEQLPACMKTITKMLENPQTPINVRLFIGRLIILLERHFTGCSKQLFKPLLSLFLDQSCGSSGLHNFRIDILVTLLSWSDKFTIEVSNVNKKTCSELLQYFLLYCSSENTAVIRRNMQILNLILRLWPHELFVIDPKIVLDFLGAGKNLSSDKMLTIGLQILAVLLKNDIDIRSDEDITGKLFSRTFSCLDHNYVRICKLAAEASGLLFRFLHMKEENYDKLLNFVENLFVNLKLKNLSKFLTCFCIFQRHFALLTSKFIKDVLASLMSVHGEYKNSCLEIIHDFVGAENAQEIFVELKAKGLASLLTVSDQSRQLWALRIINKVADHLSIGQFSDLMPHLMVLSNHKDLECRSLLCSMLMRNFDRLNNSDIREALIRFLSDPDLGLRQTIFNFWSHESRLSQNTLNRTTKILSQIYCSGDVEEQFLCHANYLLLELSSKSPDFERPLFDKPLKDCQYSNLPISTNWRQRYASLRSGSVGSQILIAAGTAMGTAQLKSTLAPENAQFTLTQGAYDWMSGSFFNNTYADLNLSLNESSISTKAGNVPENLNLKKYRNMMEVEKSFDESPASQAIENELRYLKRRILKDQSKTSQMYAKIETKRKGIREKTQAEQKIANEQNVTLYRNYRQGDFPDIQISFCNLIKPLQAVAQRDSLVASLLFESLLTNIVEEGSKNALDNASVELYRNIGLDLEKILRSTTVYSKQLMLTILAFCFKHSLNFVINPETISNVCLNGQYEKFGIILLEKYICQFSETSSKNGRSASPPTKKSKFIEADVENSENFWIQLFRLYKSIDEYDCVRVIFTDFLNTKKLTKLGLEKEKLCDYMEAVRIYTEALQRYSGDLMTGTENEENLLLEAEVEYWDESRLRCLSWLNDWETMVDITTRSIDPDGVNFSAIWEDDTLQQTFLPYLIRSQSKLIVHRGITAKKSKDDSSVAFSKFLSESSRDSEKKQFLEDNEAFSLALLSFMENEDEKCKFLCKKLLDKCLKDWSLSSVSDMSFRKMLLQDAQRSCEFLHFLDYRKSSDSSNLRKLLYHWVDRSPNYAEDDSLFWDDILVNRTLFNEETCGRAIEQDPMFKIERGNELKFISYSGEAKMRLQFVENCLLRNNYHVAFHQLNFVKQLVNLMTQISKNDRATVSITYDYCNLYAKAQFFMLHRCGGGIFDSENAPRLINTLSTTARLSTKGVEFETLKADILSEISWLLLDMKDQTANNNSLSKSVRQSLRIFCDEEENVDRPICPLELLEKSFRIYSSNVENGSKLVKFCDQTLRRLENENSISTSSDFSPIDLAECMVETLLNNMQMGDLEARRLFPRILQMSELYPSLSEGLESLDSVPCWMFLSWIDYIVSILHTPIGRRLWNVVERLSKEYPNAIVGPLLLKRYYLESVECSDKDVLSYIDCVLKNVESKETMDNFVANVGLLRDPGLFFNDVLKRIDLLLHDNKTVEFCFKREFDDLFTLIFMSTNDLACYSIQTSESFFVTDNASLGSSWKKIVEELRPKLVQILGEKMDKSISLEKVQNLKDLIEKSAKELSNLNIKFKNLVDYSAWLKNFDSGKCLLEIPGQYNSDSKPDPSKHVLVECFDDEIFVFQSLRKPRTLALKGDDGVDYKFLIKVGEDLRQDQRLQRIFAEMNDHLSRDAVSKKLGCKLETYLIVPLSTNVGMIEMLENVESLKQFMIRSEPKRCYMKNFITTAAAQMIKNNFFGSAKSDFKAESYMESYENVPNQHVKQVFTKIQSSVESGLLRRSILKICRSPESFFTLRQQFVASYSTLCVAHYILGIGDRHLDNFLFNYRTCTIVGIDFGYVFGTSVQILGVPELVPFRLTKQITDVVESIGVKAFFQPQMAHCMKTLRQNADSLMNILDVFVKEPTINWMHEAKKQSIQMSLGDEMEKAVTEFEPSLSTGMNTTEHWYPKQKMQTVWRKFHGDNPTLILEEEISLSRSNQRMVNGKLFPVDKVLNVVHNSGLSHRYAKSGLTPENQVECLIDLATDALILARMYIGWEPWF